MCYPKPGPRCSAHARTSLLRAKDRVMGASPFDNPEHYMKMKEAEKKAKDSFDATPAGQRYLKRRIVQGMDKDGSYAARLELGKLRREEMLKEFKDNQTVEDSHSFTEEEEQGIITRFHEATEHDFPEKGSARVGWDREGGRRSAITPQIEAMVDDSSRWLSSLSADEHEAVSWFTSDGFSAVNSHLQGRELPDYMTKYSTEHVEKTAELLSSAIDKNSSEEPVIVWRGLSMDHFGDAEEKYPDADFREAMLLDAKDRFKVGEEWSPGVPMSTSYDPSAGKSFSTSRVILEIKSKRQAPVCVASAWGVSEREAITHPESRYRVVAVEENARFISEGRDGKQVESECLVIQLEELT